MSARGGERPGVVCGFQEGPAALSTKLTQGPLTLGAEEVDEC